MHFQYKKYFCVLKNIWFKTSLDVKSAKRPSPAWRLTLAAIQSNIVIILLYFSWAVIMGRVDFVALKSFSQIKNGRIKGILCMKAAIWQFFIAPFTLNVHIFVQTKFFVICLLIPKTSFCYLWKMQCALMYTSYSIAGIFFFFVLVSRVATTAKVSHGVRTIEIEQTTW